MDKKRINEFGFGGEDEKATDAAAIDAAKEEEEKKTNWESFLSITLENFTVDRLECNGESSSFLSLPF